jgi:hypothetical protein
VLQVQFSHLQLRFQGLPLLFLGPDRSGRKVVKTGVKSLFSP